MFTAATVPVAVYFHCPDIAPALCSLSGYGAALFHYGRSNNATLQGRRISCFTTAPLHKLWDTYVKVLIYQGSSHQTV